MGIDPIWVSVVVTGFIAGATIVLVWVTNRYAKATAEIVEEMRNDRVETQKDRKLRYIERRLEKLYYPIQRLREDVPQQPGREECSDNIDVIKIGKMPFWNYRYLGSRKFVEKLEQLHKMCRTDKIKEFLDFYYHEVLATAEEEISEMLEGLNELTK